MAMSLNVLNYIKRNVCVRLFARNESKKKYLRTKTNLKLINDEC